MSAHSSFPLHVLNMELGSLFPLTDTKPASSALNLSSSHSYLNVNPCPILNPYYIYILFLGTHYRDFIT